MSKKFDFKFEAVDDLGTMRDMIIHEVRAFRDFVRRPYNGEEEILILLNTIMTI